jgi:putative transposase
MLSKSTKKQEVSESPGSVTSRKAGSQPLVFKVELDPTCKQIKLFKNHADAARFAYNWGLEKKIEAYKKDKSNPSAYELHKQLVVHKQTDKENGGFPWLKEVSKCAPSKALQNLDLAFKFFFSNCKKGKKQKGFPKFKSKHKAKKSFYLDGALILSEEGKKIKLPVIGYVKLKQSDYIPKDCKIKSCVILEQAGRWFVSVMTDLEIPLPSVVLPDTLKEQDILGLDVGIKTLMTLSDGTIYDNPKAYAKARAKLRRSQRAVSRKKKGSKNRDKAISRVQKQHYRVSCIRKDALHKATSAVIAKQPKVLCVETLNVKGMVKNHSLAASVSDAAFGEILRQLAYKCARAGILLVRADRFYPSSKTCSNCHKVKDSLTLSEREYSCEFCGMLLDRDLNAAKNLAFYAVSKVRRASGSPPGSIKLPVENV